MMRLGKTLCREELSVSLEHVCPGHGAHTLLICGSVLYACSASAACATWNRLAALQFFTPLTPAEPARPHLGRVLQHTAAGPVAGPVHAPAAPRAPAPVLLGDGGTGAAAADAAQPYGSRCASAAAAAAAAMPAAIPERA